MSAATRSGLLFGIFAFFSNLGLGILLAICTPLCGIVWGAGAGIGAVVWSDRSNENPGVPRLQARLEARSPARDGAVAGAIAGVGALLGVVIGLVLQFAVLGGQESASQITSEFYEQFDLYLPPAELNSSMQWVGLSFAACCLGLFNLLVLAGAGAAAAAIYHSMRGDKAQEEAV